ncbi:MAG: glutathione synthase [Gammaproteobacteria bacterium]|nr:glutathione synthase [Gammaproteobacteria bacterium]
MRIGFFVNDVMTELAAYTTTRLALTATNRGHESWYFSAADFTYGADGRIHARGTRVPKGKYPSTQTYMADLKGARAVREQVTVDDIDVLMLRSDPANDTGPRAWAQTAGITFGRVAKRRGVIVVNDPDSLLKAMNKMYFQHFPEEVRPKTLISRNHGDIKSFLKEMGGNAVIKPLQGSGGTGVFMANVDDRSNINQMIDTLIQDGYVIAQEYLPAAAEGDTRLFMMNGKPLRYRGKYAAFRRLRKGEDMRSNIHAGGRKAKAEISASHLRLAEIVRPKLVQDGMFLVGLDIVGDKLMEINVFSPGGLGSAQQFERVNFNDAVIDALQRKVGYMSHYHRHFENEEMAML